MKRIVSVAPTWIEADSRTYKEAESFARFGYESIVVEGGTSQLPEGQASFRLVSLGTTPLPKASDTRSRASESGGSPPEMRVSCASRGVDGVRRFLGFLLPEPVKRILRPVLAGLIVGHGLFQRYFWRPFRCLPSADLYYLHAPYQFPGVFLRSKLHRVPFIYDAHDFYQAINPPEENNRRALRLLTRLHRRIEAACVRTAAEIVTVSAGVAQLIEEEFGRSCVVIRNCHDFRIDRAPVKGMREVLELPDDAFLLVAVGRSKTGAAIEEACRALSRLPEHVHLALLGQGYEARLRNVKDLSERLHAVPPVKPYEVVPFIRSADAALILYLPVSPNYTNCLPNGFFQSVAAELPLLYPSLPEIRGIAETYGIGLPIDPLRPSSIVESVLKLLENRSLYTELKANLREAGRELSWGHEESVLIDVVRMVLAESDAGAGEDCLGSRR